MPAPVKFEIVKGPVGQIAPPAVTVQVTALPEGQVNPEPTESVTITPFAGDGPWFDKEMTYAFVPPVEDNDLPSVLAITTLAEEITGVLTLPVQAGAVPVHSGSPPPVTVALLTLGLAAVNATLTGTVITILPVAAPAAIEQPARLVAPDAGQPLNVPPVAVIVPLVVIPVGKASAMVVAAVVGPFATAMVMV